MIFINIDQNEILFMIKIWKRKHYNNIDMKTNDGQQKNWLIKEKSNTLIENIYNLQKLLQNYFFVRFLQKRHDDRDQKKLCTRVMHEAYFRKSFFLSRVVLHKIILRKLQLNIYLIIYRLKLEKSLYKFVLKR